ncbi:MAG: GNAT family N-acetyltransferase [Burkholderiales bacterium]|nr:GNAT family N-acetyltransferase [Burkholderiales bacterium]
MSTNAPVHLTTAWPVFFGHAVTVRPLLPTDADLEIELGRSLSSESLHHRFLNGGIKLNPRLLDRLLNVDFSRDLALIATATFAGAETPLAVARYARLDDDPHAAEIAVTVADPWQGYGIGKRLLGRLIECAADAGLRRLLGDVHATNRRMLGLAGALGFGTRFHPDGGHLRLIELALDGRVAPPHALHEVNDL